MPRSSVQISMAALIGLPVLQLAAEKWVTLPIGPTRMLTIGLCALALAPIVLSLLESWLGESMSRRLRWGVVLAVPVLAVAHLLVLARVSEGPFGPVPGGPFRSATVSAPPFWSALASRRYAEIEVDLTRPRTLETVFLVHDGDLYVAANMPERKSWPNVAREDGAIRLRFDDDEVYALDAHYVDSIERTAVLRDALNEKYGFDLSMGGPIWFFALERRPTRVGTLQPSTRPIPRSRTRWQDPFHRT
jgi:hypothetical protein